MLFYIFEQTVLVEAFAVNRRVLEKHFSGRQTAKAKSQKAN
jgi:hypothetical protein